MAQQVDLPGAANSSQSMSRVDLRLVCRVELIWQSLKVGAGEEERERQDYERRPLAIHG